MRKRKRVSQEQVRRLQGEEYYARTAETQRLLAERIAYHRGKIEEERRLRGE